MAMVKALRERCVIPAHNHSVLKINFTNDAIPSMIFVLRNISMVTGRVTYYEIFFKDILIKISHIMIKSNQPAQPISVIDNYVNFAPSPQNALDIFQGEWSSILPEPFKYLKAGTAALLFEDARIKWFADEVGGVANKTILELGPLEAGHTYMLEKLGASQITSIESNTRAFLKCLIIKELLELKHVRFLCGDFCEFLRQIDSSQQFQICVASGVLYHMRNPAELIALLTRHCTEHLFIWTHYYDANLIRNNPALSAKFPSAHESEYEGFKHTLYRQEYQTALEWNGFCGGSASFSYWMGRDDIALCLQHFGFEIQVISFDDPHHSNGPAFALIARHR